MNVRALKPFVPSGRNFATTKQFFQDLGFIVRWESDGLAELSLGAATFLLQDFDHREMQENLMMLVEVDDLDAWWQHLLASGVAERYPGVRLREPTLFPWGRREIHITDPAGVCWHFA